MTRTAGLLLGLLLGGCAAMLPPGPDPLPPPAAPTDARIEAGLREALAQGVDSAVGHLGRPNGFWANAAARIPLPPALARAEPTLRKLGLGERLDAFHLALNRAAEQAMPEAAGVFAQAVGTLSVDDARALLGGPSDAITEHFRRVATPQLQARLRPRVAAVTASVGVTQKYKALVADYAALLERAGAGQADLDAHIADAAIEGLFYLIAAEEARIRRDPRARGSELLRQVFGAL